MRRGNPGSGGPFGGVAPPKLWRKGKCAPEVSPYNQVFHDYGWTATLYVDLTYRGYRSDSFELSEFPPNRRRSV